MRAVSDIMTTTVRTMHRDTYVCDVERVFVTNKISGAPLVDDSGDIVGFVSNSDVTRFDSTGDDPNYARVHEIANSPVFTIDPTAPIEEAAQKMLIEHVHHLVVMDEETIVGMLSAFDFVELVASGSREH